MVEKSILIFSLPRSWSTYFSSELVVRSGKQLLYENLRRFFRKDFNHPLHASHALWDTSIHQALHHVSLSDKIKYTNFLDTIASTSSIVKETDAIFHIEQLRKVLWKEVFIGLTRSLFGVLNAHLKISNIWDRRKYEWRSNTNYASIWDNIKSWLWYEYLECFESAKWKDFRWIDWIPNLCVHLWVQLSELKRLCKNNTLLEVKYEDLWKDELKEAYFYDILQRAWILDTWNRRELTKKSQSKWVHTTKHTSLNALQWIDNFTYQDIKFFESLFSDTVLQNMDLWYENLKFKSESIVVPNFTSNYWFIEDSKPIWEKWETYEESIQLDYTVKNILWREVSISNLPIRNLEFVEFLNYYLDKWFRNIHQLIHSDISSKEIYFDQQSLTYKVNSNASLCPAVNLSIIGSALYCIHSKMKLLNQCLYKELHNSSTTPYIWNYWEKNSTTTPIWQYMQQDWLYDLYWNVKELCLESDWRGWFEAWTYWWSYKSEAPFIVSGKFNKVPLFVCESDIGFRICNEWEIGSWEDNSIYDISWYLIAISKAQNEEELLSVYYKILSEAVFKF